MARAFHRTSSQWRYWFRLVQELPFSELAQSIKHFPVRRWSGPGGWLLVSAGAVAMLYLNGRLVFATGAGVAVMLLIYLMHDWKPELPWAELHKFLDGWNQPFVLAVAGGSIATLTTYMAASVWADSTSHWIAAASIMQGIGTLAVLVLLSRQILSHQANREQVSLNQLLTELTHDDPVRRLIAVRQLSSMAPVWKNDLLEQRQIGECFRLMLSQEQEPIVREAVLDGLQALNRVRSLKQATQPEVDPEMLRRSRAKSRKRVPVR